MDFLHGGITNYASLVIAYSGGGKGDFIKEVLRVYTCAFSRGRLGIIERLRLASEDFRILLLRFKRNRITLSPLVYLVWLIVILTISSALESFD
jgi:hypothetical protein